MHDGYAPLPVLALGLVLALVGCATPPEHAAEQPAEQDTWAGQRIGPQPLPQPAIRQALLSLAEREWDYFGKQRVVYSAEEESIPHVGLWEDDDPQRIARVNQYWRAVGRPDLTGRQCQAPWSAAFMSWLMREAGVPEGQFPPAAAHRGYLAQLIASAGEAGRYFVPRSIATYRPAPGDLICASAEVPRSTALAGQVTPETLQNVRSHCDLVVRTEGRTLEAIGGNVRNSVSRSVLELDGAGHLQPVERRSWFLVLENRL